MDATEFFPPQFAAMRVAITLEKFDLLRGGAEVASLRLVNELASRGHEVHVVTTSVAVGLPPGVHAHRFHVPWNIVAWRQISIARQVEQRLRSLACDLSIAAVGRGFSEDVLWAQGGTQRATTDGKARSLYFNPLRCAAVRHQHHFNLRTWVYHHLERQFFARSPQPFVIAPSRMIADGFRRDFGVGDERIRVVPYQVDLNRFSPEKTAALRTQSRAGLKLPPDELVILCAAQNFRRKGVRPLIEAAAVLHRKGSSFLVLVAGLTARHAAPYQALARRLGCAERIRFIGHHNHMEELYAAADVFCLPTFYDPCAIASVEAMACGLASVTSRYNGAAEWMTHGQDGLVVAEPQEAGALAAELEKLFSPDARARLGAAAARTARWISRDNPANEIARVVEELAECKHADARRSASR